MGRSWSRAIVVGASSGIGAAVARALAREGCRLGLVARRRALLDELAADLDRGRPERLAHVYAHDVTAAHEVPDLFQRICRDLGGLDLVVHAAGVMPPLQPDEYSFDKDREIVAVNLLGAIAWLNEAAQRFARARAGTIVGISSVAGDRGRRGNPAYCASKAALDAYLEAIRHRVARLGVTVVTVKPGPVDTPMSRHVARRPLLISAEECARQTLAAARRGRAAAYVPRAWRPIMFAVRNLPHAIFKRLDI